MLHPGDCSPSRSVVSNIKTLSDIGPPHGIGKWSSFERGKYRSQALLSDRSDGRVERILKTCILQPLRHWEGTAPRSASVKGTPICPTVVLAYGVRFRSKAFARRAPIMHRPYHPCDGLGTLKLSCERSAHSLC